MKQHSRLALVACAALLLAACERKENRSETERSNTGGGPGAQPTTPVGSEMATAEKKAERKGIMEEQPGTMGSGGATGGGPIEGQMGSRSWARDKLASARCEHWQTCGEIAKGKKYDTLDSCVTRERADLDKSWTLDKCQKIDSPRLDTCLKATRDLKCAKVIAKSPDECDQDKVCMAP
jgi:hypothetical protein